MTKEEVKELAEEQGVALNESEAIRIADYLMPMGNAKFEDMQQPDIEILKDNGAVKLKLSYTIS